MYQLSHFVKHCDPGFWRPSSHHNPTGLLSEKASLVISRQVVFLNDSLQAGERVNAKLLSPVLSLMEILMAKYPFAVPEFTSAALLELVLKMKFAARNPFLSEHWKFLLYAGEECGAAEADSPFKVAFADALATTARILRKHSLTDQVEFTHRLFMLYREAELGSVKVSLVQCVHLNYSSLLLPLLCTL